MFERQHGLRSPGEEKKDQQRPAVDGPENQGQHGNSSRRSPAIVEKRKSETDSKIMQLDSGICNMELGSASAYNKARAPA